MAILIECPICHRKQSNKNKRCVCGSNLDSIKKSGKMRYWITYRVEGKQRTEYAGTDHQAAVASEGKRKAQKAENRILDIVRGSKATFQELAEWYLSQTAVTRLKSFKRVQIGIQNFNAVFGGVVVSSMKKEDIVNYQETRLTDHVRRGISRKPGTNMISPQTIDTEIMLVKTMVNAALVEDKIDGSAVKAFKQVKKLVVKGSNARRRILSFDEFCRIIDNAQEHIQGFIVIALNTGARLGEIRQLRWGNIDKDRRFIRLGADDTKEGKQKVIPINHHVKKLLEKQSRWVHHDFVLTYHGDPIMTPGGIKHGFQAAVKAAGILHGRDVQNGLIFHDIRRTVKTLMLQAGIDKVHRDMILGHSLQGMDSHYMVGTDNDLMRAMDAYTQYLDGSSW